MFDLLQGGHYDNTYNNIAYNDFTCNVILHICFIYYYK